MTTPLTWITYRPPTEADGDSDGDVYLHDHTSDAGVYVHWSYVRDGAPWSHSRYRKTSAPATRGRSILGGLQQEKALFEAEIARQNNRGSASRQPKTAPPATVAIPRRFVSVRRTIEPHTIHCHVLDAVADDGTAWWMRLDADADGDEPSWTELLPLPARQEPEF